MIDSAKVRSRSLPSMEAVEFRHEASDPAPLFRAVADFVEERGVTPLVAEYQNSLDPGYHETVTLYYEVV